MVLTINASVATTTMARVNPPRLNQNELLPKFPKVLLFLISDFTSAKDFH